MFLLFKRSVYWVNIPVITEVECSDSIRRLDVNSGEDNKNIDVNQSQSFASGSVFINTLIDSLTALSYFKPEIIKLIETLLSGGLTTKLETILCETDSLKWKALSSESLRNRDRCRVTQIALRGPLLSYKTSKYGQLFTEVLNTYGMLCFGVYRILDDNESNTDPDIRYVITNPSNDFQLKPNDLVFITIFINFYQLMQFFSKKIFAFIQMETKI